MHHLVDLLIQWKQTMTVSTKVLVTINYQFKKKSDEVQFISFIITILK